MSEEPSERERLVRYVEAAEGHFSLTMARYADEGLARGLWEEAITQLQARGRTIAVVDFTGITGDVDILARISSLAVGVEGAFVVGLEELLIAPDDRPRATEAIATLNFNRDLLRDRLQIPVVLWLSERAARAFALLAADTFDIVRTTFEFPERRKPTPAPHSERQLRVRPSWSRPASAAERPQLEARLQTLESLHSDAERGNINAADLAASAASVAFALDLEERGLEWLAEAARGHERDGSLAAAATDRRRRAEFLAYRVRLDEAGEEIELASRLAMQATGVDDMLGLLPKRSDIVAARAAIERARGDDGDDDFQLLERWQAGDRHAGEILLRRYFAVLHGFFLHKVEVHDVEALIREVFLRIVKTARGHRYTSTFRSYLFRVARHVLFEEFPLRSLSSHSETVEADAYVGFAAPLDQTMAELQRSANLLQALRGLSPNTQMILELYYWLGVRGSELAEVLDVPENTARFRLRQAKNQLRRAFARLDDTLTDIDLAQELQAAGRRILPPT